nr:FGGY family carbohydrate kinase [Chloroflexota bacterium]
MTRDGYVAALDAGIGGGRCLLLDAGGDVAGTAYREWDYIHPADIPGGCAFAPDRFWALLCAATREAIARAGIPTTAVRAISATSMREGFVLLDAQGREIHATAPLD